MKRRRMEEWDRKIHEGRKRKEKGGNQGKEMISVDCGSGGVSVGAVLVFVFEFVVSY